MVKCHADVNDTTRYSKSGRDRLSSVAFTKDEGVISLVFLTKLLARHSEGTDFSPTDMELSWDLIINHTRDYLPPNEREQARDSSRCCYFEDDGELDQVGRSDKKSPLKSTWIWLSYLRAVKSSFCPAFFSPTIW